MKYMDCTRIFRTEKNDLGRHFFVNLNNSLTNSQNHVADTDDQELSLVGQDEMEEMVVITTMHAKAMNIYGEDVNHLEARLEYLEIMCQEIFDKAERVSLASSTGFPLISRICILDTRTLPTKTTSIKVSRYECPVTWII